MPAPESRPHYYVRQGLWRLRTARLVAPWLLLAIPVAAVVAVAAFDGKKIWHATVDRGATPKAATGNGGSFKPRTSSSRGSANGGSASAAGSAAAAASSNSSGRAVPVSAVSSQLLDRIHILQTKIAALLDGGLTSAERVQLWRLRLRLAIAYRRLIRAEITALQRDGLTAAERARLDALFAQLKGIDKRIAVLTKINRILRGGVTASERARLDGLVSAFLQLKAQAPLPVATSLVTTVRVTASTGGGTSTTGGVAGVSTTLTGTTVVDAGATAGASNAPATADSSPGNSEFGHSHKKPKKPKR